MSKIPNETIDVELVDEELKAPVLQDIKYPVKKSDLELLINEYKDIPSIDLDADEEEIGKQYQFVLAGHKKFVKARNQIEKVRKTLKAPALEYGKKVDSIAKEFQSKIKPIEDKLAFERRKVEDNEARKQREAEEAEERRIEAIQAKLSSMERLPLEMMQKNSVEIREFIGSFDVPKEEEFEEFCDKALLLHSQIKSQLVKMADEKELVENAKKLQAEREEESARLEAERQEKLQAEREAFEKEKAEFEAQKARLKAEQEAIQAEKDREEAQKRADELQRKQEEEMQLMQEERTRQFEKKYDEAKKVMIKIGDPHLILEAIVSGSIPHVKWED